MVHILFFRKITDSGLLSVSSDISSPRSPTEKTKSSNMMLTYSPTARIRTFSAGSRDFHQNRKSRIRELLARQFSTQSTPGDVSHDKQPVNSLSGSISSSKRNLSEITSQMSLAGGSVINEENLLETRKPIEEESENDTISSRNNGKHEPSDKEKGELVGEEEMETGKVCVLWDHLLVFYRIIPIALCMCCHSAYSV